MSAPVALFGSWKGANTSFENNLYWHAGEKLDFAGNTFEQWKALGSDAGSQRADPAFTDAPSLSFSVPADSAATGVGFVPFDTQNIGLYGDEKWRQLPQKYPIRPDDPEPPTRAPETIRDDFEKLSIGRTPGRAQTYTSKTATCSVTDEVAAHGSHSLKFVDAAGQSASHLPHIYYEGNFHDGAMRFAFGFMNNATNPANADIVMPDWSKSSYVDGPLISFKKNGRVMLPGQPALGAPLGRWIHVEAAFRLGRKQDRATDWSISISWGTETREFKIPLDPKFQSLTWTGIMAPADESGIFYLDNLLLEPTD